MALKDSEADRARRMTGHLEEGFFWREDPQGKDFGPGLDRLNSPFRHAFPVFGITRFGITRFGITRFGIACFVPHRSDCKARWPA